MGLWKKVVAKDSSNKMRWVCFVQNHAGYEEVIMYTASYYLTGLKQYKLTLPDIVIWGCKS